ncbi:hypothetical protein IEQ34_019304 [Dendrobium chrysotoxum]|uniref:Uncharacterized protein n=1 Tax=Dendrobium chrysotoxum TaxID=161865 RepID=A0AAV7G7D9_DENCH|nr:hypothetical protein IEQ34_019304 [Dendrobium chrysotoxum]
MQSATTLQAESPAKDKIKGASSDLVPVPPGTSSLLLANTPIWAKWVISCILYLTIPLYKRVLRIEDEVEKEVIDVVEIIKRVAKVTEKTSSDLADALPAGSDLKKLATEVEDDAEEVNIDAEKVEAFINKVDDVKDEIEAWMDQIDKEWELIMPEDAIQTEMGNNLSADATNKEEKNVACLAS